MHATRYRIIITYWNQTAPAFYFHSNNACWSVLGNAPVPLRPAVLRFIPEPPGHPGSWTGVNRVKMTVFLPKNLDGRPSRPSKTREHPGAPRFIQVEPRQGHGSSRRLHGSPRFSGRFSTVHPGPCRQNPGDATVLPGSPRRSYGPSRFIPAR